MLNAARRSRRGAASTAGDATRRLLPRLTSLRAFAALAVFVFHLHAEDVASLPWGIARIGGTGVAFFFVLSGFVLAGHAAGAACPHVLPPPLRAGVPE